MKRVFPPFKQRSLYDTSHKTIFIKKYEPKLCRVSTWDNIQDRFDNYFGEQYKNNIGRLVRHIKDTGLTNKLFGVAAMDKLVIGIYNPLEWDRETLHVTFDAKNQQWKFVYYSLPFQAPEFVRLYSEDKGIEKFDNFMAMINW